jgi:putative inorganic carbon (HCO3(-)) transporter
LGLDPNEVAGVLLWFLPLQMALLGRMWRRGSLRTPRALALACSTLLEAAVLILTQSRGAWLGLACGLLVMGALVDRRVRWVTLGLGGCALLATAVRGPQWVAEALQAEALEGLVGELVWTDRFRIWRVAVQAIRDFPFTGVGLGTFRRVARLVYALDVYPGFDIGHAHNGWLQAGVDLGVPGLVAYGAVWFCAAGQALAACRRARGGSRALALGLAGCLASSLAYNLSDTIALGARPGFAWWMLLGLVVATWRMVERERQ